MASFDDWSTKRPQESPPRDHRQPGEKGQGPIGLPDAGPMSGIPVKEPKSPLKGLK